MATLVADNPYDTQPAAPANTGIVGGAINNISTGANANQQYNPYGNLSAQQYTAQTREVDRPTETVAGQVDSILSKDSPLMQRARTLATQQMAQRGLVNSSMNAGAGTAAMIDRATPIASADANTYSNRALANMQATNEANQFSVGQNNNLFAQGTDIASRTGLQKDQQAFSTSERLGGQDFTAGQNTLDRTQRDSLQAAQLAFTGAQNDLSRAQEVSLADKSIAANTALATAQQNFTAAQNDLGRAQDVTLADKNIAANVSQNVLNQQFTAAQNTLDRTQQKEIADLNITAQNAAVPRTFASNTSLSTLNSIQAIQADPNIDAANKPAAIQNVIDVANSTLQWGATFYNTVLPTIAAPGVAGSFVGPPAGSPIT